MTIRRLELSRAIRSGASAALLGFALVSVGSVPAHGQTAEIPGQLIGSWTTEDKTAYMEFEADGTYVFSQSGETSYAELGNFQVQQQQIQYSPEVAQSQGQEQTPPGAYVETWAVEPRSDGTDQLVTKGESGSLAYLEMDISQCSAGSGN